MCSNDVKRLQFIIWYITGVVITHFVLEFFTNLFHKNVKHLTQTHNIYNKVYC